MTRATAEEERVRPWLRLLPGLGILMIVALHGWSLMRYPAPFVDEAWYASRAMSLIQTGKAFGALDAGVFDRFPGYWTYFQWVPVWLQSLTLRVAGAPSLLALRLLSLSFGAVLACAVFSIGKSLGGVRHGVWAVILLSLSQAFFYSGHLARYDIFAAALGFLAIAIHLRNVREEWAPALLEGFLVGLAFEIHPYAIIFAPTLAILELQRCKWRFWRRPSFAAFIAGGSIGAVGYLALHVLRFPETYFALNRLVYTATHTPPIATLDPVLMLTGLAEGAAMLAAFYTFAFPVILAAVFLLLRKRLPQNAQVLTMAGMMFLGLALFVRNKIAYYGILVTPAFDLLLAAFLVQTPVVLHPMRGWALAAKGGAALMVVASIAFNLSPLRADQSRAYLEVQRRIDASIRQSDRVMGPQTYWFGLTTNEYLSWEQLIYYQRYLPGATLRAALEEFRPDVFIIDAHLDQFILDEPGTQLYEQYLRLPKGELAEALSEEAELIDTFWGGPYGQVRVYRFHWPG